MTRPPVWVHELARRFWDEAGEVPTFPRDLREVLGWIARVHVIEVPDLTLARAARALAPFGVPFAAVVPDRKLDGCFAGYRGYGHILFDPLLSPAEVRFTLAHELAHWLRDYDDPRRRVAARLGARALEVLDGTRAPTPEERFEGVLREVPVGPFAHFLDRDRHGRTRSADARDAEDAADRLALELLAPFGALRPFLATRAGYRAALVSHFGLPAREADRATARLFP